MPTSPPNPPKPPANQSRQVKGRQGEQLARQLLLSKGFTLLAQNYKTKVGEIDLIFWDGETLVFVEVKTRTRFEQGLPEEAVTPQKLYKIERTGTQFALEYDLMSSPMRIDVVAIELLGSEPVIRHLIDVTGH